MTPSLSELRAMEERATPMEGAQIIVPPRKGRMGVCSLWVGEYADEGEPDLMIECVSERPEKDIAWVQALLNAAPSLLAEVERLRGEREGLVERCVAICESVRERERNVGEDCPGGGWGGYKLGARDCAVAIRAALAGKGE